MSVSFNFVVRFIIAPLDVVKIRLQLQAHGTGALKDAVVEGPTYRGIFDAMRTIVRQEGIRGLWKGNIPAEMLYMTYGPVQFVTLKECTLFMQRATPQIPEAPRNFIAGGVAGAAATAATYPFDLLRTRFAAQGNQKVRIRLIGRRHGWHNVTATRFIRLFCTRFAISMCTRVCGDTTAA
jgi:solute carrier family 25 thiamine pyrophosphate transporter 19